MRQEYESPIAEIMLFYDDIITSSGDTKDDDDDVFVDSVVNAEKSL